jgi:hypothetical protein
MMQQMFGMWWGRRSCCCCSPAAAAGTFVHLFSKSMGLTLWGMVLLPTSPAMVFCLRGI